MDTIDINSLGLLLSQIIRMHHTYAHRVFGELGLYRGQPPVLFTLWRQDGLTQKEISQKLKLRPATITDALKRMEKSGLVVRRQDPKDLRFSHVYLTEKGDKLQSEVEKAFKSFEKECFYGFTPEQEDMLKSFFMKIRDNLLNLVGDDTNC